MILLGYPVSFETSPKFRQFHTQTNSLLRFGTKTGLGGDSPFLMPQESFFDARLANLEGNVLTLDFSDATKFQEGHDLKKTLPTSSHASLVTAIRKVTGAEFTLVF